LHNLLPVLCCYHAHARQLLQDGLVGACLLNCILGLARCLRLGCL
jgi:hypothetical protein